MRLLLLHQQLHNHFRRIGYWCAGTEDGGDFGKGGVAAQIRAQGTPEAYGKVGNAMRQEKSHLHAVMVGGYLAEGATGFILRLNAEEQL